MNNRDRVIAAIEQQFECERRRNPQGLIIELIEQLNSEAAKRWKHSPWKFVLWTLAIVLVINVRSPILVLLPVWAAYVIFFGGFFVLAWLLHVIPKRLNTTSVSIYVVCTACGYSLEDHDSVLGDDIWVGPEICPECGCRYPAIG